MRWLAADVLAFKGDFSGAWFEQSGDGAQCGRFAGAIRADERDDFALIDMQRNACQRFNGAVVYRDILYP